LGRVEKKLGLARIKASESTSTVAGSQAKRESLASKATIKQKAST